MYFLLFIIAFVFIVRHFSGLEKDFLLLERVKPWWLFAAMLSQFTTYLAAALIYRLLLPMRYRKGFHQFGTLVRAAVVALFFNQTVPSASLSGGVFIYRFLRQWRLPPARILLTILSELFVYYLAVEILLLGLLLSGVTFFSLKHIFLILLSLGLLVYPVLGILLLTVSQKNLLPSLYAKLSHLRFLQRKIKSQMDDPGSTNQLGMHTSVFRYLHAHKTTSANAILLQLLVLLADGMTIYALFHGLGIQVSFYTVMLVMSCTQVVSLLPFLPGSLLLYESSMSWFFASLLVPPGSAIVVTMLYRLLSFWMPMPFGLLFYRQWLRNKKAVTT